MAIDVVITITIAIYHLQSTACTDVDMTWEIFQYYKLRAPSVLLTWLNRSGKPVKTMPSTPKGKLNAIGNWQEKASYEGDRLRAKKKRKYGL